MNPETDKQLPLYPYCASDGETWMELEAPSMQAAAEEWARRGEWHPDCHTLTVTVMEIERDGMYDRSTAHEFTLRAPLRGLEHLLYLLREHPADPRLPHTHEGGGVLTIQWDRLPTFGVEPPPADTREIWSWDDERVLTGPCRAELVIRPRTQRKRLRCTECGCALDEYVAVSSSVEESRQWGICEACVGSVQTRELGEEEN